MNNREKFEKLQEAIVPLKRHIEMALLKEDYRYDQNDFLKLESKLNSLKEISIILKDGCFDICPDDIDYFNDIIDFCNSVFMNLLLEKANDSSIKLLNLIEQSNRNFNAIKRNLVKIKNVKNWV